MENLQELFNNLYGSDLESLKIVTAEYLKLTDKDYIESAGMNYNTGYVYLALESGVCIASCFGQEATFIVTDFEDGEEYFEDSYQDAIDKIYQLSNNN